MTPPRTRGRPSAAKGDDTRRFCLDAAIRVFAANGYARTGMRAIAEEAGVTAPALYNYFPSKAVLYGAAWTTALEEVYAEYEEAVAGQTSLVDELRAILDRSAELIRERPWIPRLGLRAALDTEQADPGATLTPPAFVSGFFDALTARAIDRGEIAAGEAKRLQAFLLVLLWGLSAVTGHAAGSLDDVVEAVKWSAEGGFGGFGSASPG